jgi:hypothetical protein
MSKEEIKCVSNTKGSGKITISRTSINKISNPNSPFQAFPQIENLKKQMEGSHLLTEGIQATHQKTDDR